MKARIGDRLLPDGEQCRSGVIIGLQHPDGSPPYIVKWLGDGHIALVFPGPYTKIVRRAPEDEAAQAPSPGDLRSLPKDLRPCDLRSSRASVEAVILPGQPLRSRPGC